MIKEKYSITFACLNSSTYTKKCLESFILQNIPLDRLVVVDNGSTDDTREVLESFNLPHIIYNKKNLSCGCAWNQGALYFQSEWTIVMNNDVVISKDSIENLIKSAESNNVQVMCPSMIEGELDYELETSVVNFKNQMRGYVRKNDKHAVCMAIHESVWEEIGYFACNPKLLGYEDTLFFDALDKKNIISGITSESWIHHFGSITQYQMKKDQGLTKKDSLSSRKNYKLLNNSWIKRKCIKLQRNKFLKKIFNQEIKNYKMTIHGVLKNKTIEWVP